MKEKIKIIKYTIQVKWISSEGKEVVIHSSATTDKELRDNVEAICKAYSVHDI